MQNVEMQTDNLVNAVRESESYIHFQRAQNALAENAELHKKVNEFRRSKFFIQMNQTENFLLESEHLCGEYDVLLHNSLVEDFLIAEQMFCKMMRKINARIFDSMDINIDFLEE